MSTLPPTPSYNPNIPIVTSAGGTSAAYKDPNSPESILKKTTELAAQANVDTQYDVNRSAYKQGFKNGPTSSYSSFLRIIGILVLLYFVFKALKLVAKVILILLAVILFIVLFKRVTRTT